MRLDQFDVLFADKLAKTGLLKQIAPLVAAPDRIAGERLACWPCRWQPHRIFSLQDKKAHTCHSVLTKCLPIAQWH